MIEKIYYFNVTWNLLQLDVIYLSIDGSLFRVSPTCWAVSDATYSSSPCSRHFYAKVFHGKQGFQQKTLALYRKQDFFIKHFEFYRKPCILIRIPYSSEHSNTLSTEKFILQNTLYSIEHPVFYRTPCILQNTLYSIEHSVLYRTLCILQSILYCKEHPLLYRTLCILKNTLCSIKHPVFYRTPCILQNSLYTI